MKTRVLVGAEYAYVCIQSENRTLDVRLDHGMGAKKSLLRSAQDLRDQALKLIGRAEFIELAAGDLQ